VLTFKRRESGVGREGVEGAGYPQYYGRKKISKEVYTNEEVRSGIGIAEK
jgi:hypothetical protein